MTTTITNIIDPDNGPGTDYTSLAAWEAAEQRDLVSLDEIERAECRCTGGTAATQVTFGGWTTGVNNYVQIFTDPNDVFRHNGTFQTGNIFRIATTAGGTGVADSFDNTEHVRIIGIEFLVTGSFAEGIRLNPNGPGESFIEDCLIKGSFSGADTDSNAIFLRTFNDIHHVRNCIVYDFVNGTNTMQGMRHDDGPAFVYNCTFVNCRVGFNENLSGASNSDRKARFKNCAAKDCNDGFLTTDNFHDDCTNNASDIVSDAPGANPRTGSIVFENEAADDFRLGRTDTIARDNGVDLSTDSDFAVTKDITGRARPQPIVGGTFDIGASEVKSIVVGLFIDDIDRTGLLKIDTLNLKDRQEGRKTLSFTLVEKGATPFVDYIFFEVGNPIKLIDDAGNIIFAGSIETDKEVETVKTTGLFTPIQCSDHTAIFDRYLAAKIEEQQSAGDMVKDLVSEFIPAAENINTNDVQAGIVVDRAVFGFRKMSDVMSDLSKITAFSWFVDCNRRLQFYARSTFPAPFTITDGSANFRKISRQRKRSQYRNRQFVRGGRDTTDQRQDDFAGDADRKTFTLQFELAELVEIKVNSVVVAAVDIGIRGIDNEADFEWLVKKGDKEVTQGSGETALKSNEFLEVTYKGLFPIIVISEDTGEIASRSVIEDGPGIYENIEDDDSIESRDFAIQKANGLLGRFGEIPEIVRFETDIAIEPNAFKLRSGQLISITIARLNISGTFLIDEVSAKDIKARFLRYTVTCLSGQHLGSWFEFFRKLEDAGRSFKLNEGESLLLPRQFTEGIELTEAFNTVDALKPSSEDNTSCWTWGFAVWSKTPWCTPEQ